MAGQTSGPAAGQVAPAAMRSFWDDKARENAMYFIHSDLDYQHPDAAAFWASGEDNLDRTLRPFGVGIGPSDDVVEIGCGIGRITRPIAARARHVVGVDISAEMIERGREALADVDNVELVVGTGGDLAGLADQSADAVYSFIVFQHIPDPAVTCAYIRDIGRVLRPGGWTVFQVSDQPEIHHRHPDDRGLRAALARTRGRRPKGRDAPAWLGSAVPRADLLAALGAGGLVLEDTVGDGTQYCMVHATKAPAS